MIAESVIWISLFVLEELGSSYKNDFMLAKSDSAKKTAIKQAKKELMDKHNMSASDALNFIKGKWNPTGKGANAKYFYSGGLMSKQSM